MWSYIVSLFVLECFGTCPKRYTPPLALSIETSCASYPRAAPIPLSIPFYFHVLPHRPPKCPPSPFVVRIVA